MDKKEKEKEKYNYTPLIIFSILTIIGGFALWFYIKRQHSRYDTDASSLALKNDFRNRTSTINQEFFKKHGLTKLI